MNDILSFTDLETFWVLRKRIIAGWTNDPVKLKNWLVEMCPNHGNFIIKYDGFDLYRVNVEMACDKDFMTLKLAWFKGYTSVD